MTTATEDDVAAAFTQALAKDAGHDPGQDSPPEMPPPPPKPERDPAAPHGRDEHGEPLAPHGYKADGTPRLRPAGPGRGRRDDKPRTAPAPPPKEQDKRDYTGDLLGVADAVWLGASSIRGGALGPVQLPDLRPYAAVWHEQAPQMAAAWNQAAAQNATVRRWVERYTGDGSMTWVIGVAVSATGLAAAVIELAKAPAEVRAEAAQANDRAMQEYIAAQIRAMGLEPEGGT